MSKFPLFVIAAVLALSAVQNTANAQAMSYGPHRYSWRENPAVNVYRSQRYDYLLSTSWRFRRYRMWKECHTITWPGLRESCLGSFDQYEPFRGRWR